MLDSRPIQEVGGKRIYDHGKSYSPGLKRQKSEDDPHFLRDCRPCFAPKGDSRTFVLAPDSRTFVLAPDSRTFVLAPVNPSRQLVTKNGVSNCHISAVSQGKDGSRQAKANLHNVKRRSLVVLGTDEARVRAEALLTKRRIKAPRSKKFTPSTIRKVVHHSSSDSGDSFSREFSSRCGEKANSLSPSKCEGVENGESVLEQSPLMEKIKRFGRSEVDKEVACQVDSESWTFVANDTCKQVEVCTKDLGVKMGTSYENCRKERLSGDGQKYIDAVLHKSENFLLVKESKNESSFPFRVDIDRIKVCKALNLFNNIYDKLFQQCRLKPKSERSNVGQIPVEAAVAAKQQLKWFSTNDRVIGDVPGIKVGDQFRFRAQLVLIGLHGQYMFGIDQMKKDGKNFAISIVDSGRYANVKALDHHREIEFPDVFFYSGQGGNPQVSCGTSLKELEDQKLEGGNLALMNSMEENIPIRVIRKLPTSQVSNTRTKSGKNQAFSYDGLYVVSDCIQERGPYDKLIFKFKFNKMHGKPELAKCLVSTLDNCVVHPDISHGKEKKPIRAFNAIDKEKPPPFNYVTEMMYSKKHDEVPSCCGCDCINGCSDENPCSCLTKNGGEIPFNDTGAILKPKSIVYECGPSCKCPPSCNNRVSQNGVHHELEIFKTKSKGWGVRSRNFIASGSFVCEYAGELLTEKEAEKRTNNDEYLFDIGADSENHAATVESSCHTGSLSTYSKRSDEDGFTIDAAEYGNIGRFINHSCSPNLFAQDVLYDHNDKRRPHVMLFASKNIPPLREFSFDYNYKIGQVRDANGNVKIKNCYCGAHDCTGRMY